MKIEIDIGIITNLQLIYMGDQNTLNEENYMMT